MSLKQAYELIKAGDKPSAVKVLLPLLQADEDNVNAWWLMANALEKPEDIREALENVLRLRPDHPQARQKLDKLNAMYPPPPPRDDFDFLFGDDDPADDKAQDDFFDTLEYDDNLPVSRAPRSRPAKKSSGPSALVIVLAIVGGLTLLACAACVALPLLGVYVFQDTINTIAVDIANNPEFSMAERPMPTEYMARGFLRRGDIRQADVDTFLDDQWIFEAGAADQRISILVNTMDGRLDPQLHLYDAVGNLIASNDDIDMVNDNYNSRVDVTLPGPGTYIIIVSAFGSGGRYEIILN